MTTAGEVVARFGRSRTAGRALQQWRNDRRRAEVVEAVEAHTSDVIYRLTTGDVRDVAVRTEHALGDVRKRDVDDLVEVRDWNPPFAFTHVFHLVTEHLGTVPTFQRFREVCRDVPVLRRNLWDPALNAVARSGGGPRARAAMRWRIGNAYYSFVRELYVLAALRESGVPVQAHPLADALFRTDLFGGDVNVDVYVVNGRYRDAGGGRKHRSEFMLRDAVPPFRSVVLELETCHDFGVVHLPSDGACSRVAAELREVIG